MKRGTITVMMVLLALVLAAAVPFSAMASETMTIQGEVNDNFQIVDSDGQIYEIGDTASGNDLVENHIGKKAKVVGTVEQDEDVKIIKVTTFEILAE
jgi:hypothetical protein